MTTWVIGNSPDDIKVLDGGFGEQISRRMNKPIESDPLWSARFLHTYKQAIIETHLDFLRAGSDVITTNTYQASIEGFMEHLNLSKQESYNLIKEAVQLAKTARNIYLNENKDKNNLAPLIAGSVGPYAAFLCDGSEYTGYIKTISKEFLCEWHKPRINALIEGGVNLLAFETFPCRIEAEAVLEYLKEFPGVKAWVSFNCQNDKLLASGENFQETIKYCYDLNPNQIIAMGANCISPTYVEGLFSCINDRRSHPIPLIVYPNKGGTYNKQEGWCNNEMCLPIHDYVHKWLDLGIAWIGGCCRIYDEDIANIKIETEKWLQKKKILV